MYHVCVDALKNAMPNYALEQKNLQSGSRVHAPGHITACKHPSSIDIIKVHLMGGLTFLELPALRMQNRLLQHGCKNMQIF